MNVMDVGREVGATGRNDRGSIFYTPLSNLKVTKRTFVPMVDLGMEHSVGFCSWPRTTGGTVNVARKVFSDESPSQKSDFIVVGRN